MNRIRRISVSPSRRDFIRLAGAATASTLAPPWLRVRAQAPPAIFEIPAGKSGITWVHENAMSDQRHLPETMGPGVAFFDYDNDGWMDVFLVNSGAADFYQPKGPLKNALYRNNRDGTFTDVTDRAGVAGGKEFGMGCAIADYDNDGYADILVTAYGRCTLYHNNGNGRFTDVTDKAGVAAPGWTTSAVWFDYDNDGDLDLFLCSFVEFSVKNNVFCGDNKLGKRFYCIPRVFKPTPSLLYHNNGDGTFTLVSKGTDIERALGKGLGVVARTSTATVDGCSSPTTPWRTSCSRIVAKASGRTSACRRKWPSASTARRDRAWASMRPTSTATACRICSSRTSTRRCSRCIRTRERSSSGTSPASTESRTRPGS
jgi:hypothetical protein